jgi:hypothetical protein
MRNGTLVRTLRLIGLLTQTRGVTVHRLAQLLGVTTRTVWRDLRALEAVGCQLQRTAPAGPGAATLVQLAAGAPCPTCGHVRAGHPHTLGPIGSTSETAAPC